MSHTDGLKVIQTALSYIEQHNETTERDKKMQDIDTKKMKYFFNKLN